MRHRRFVIAILTLICLPIAALAEWRENKDAGQFFWFAKGARNASYAFVSDGAKYYQRKDSGTWSKSTQVPKAIRDDLATLRVQGVSGLIRRNNKVGLASTQLRLKLNEKKTGKNSKRTAAPAEGLKQLEDRLRAKSKRGDAITRTEIDSLLNAKFEALLSEAPAYRDPKTGVKEPTNSRGKTALRKFNDSANVTFGRLQPYKGGLGGFGGGKTVSNSKPVDVTVYLTGGGVLNDARVVFTGRNNNPPGLIGSGQESYPYNPSKAKQGHHLRVQLITPKFRAYNWDLELSKILGVEYKGKIILGKKTPRKLQDANQFAFAKHLATQFREFDAAKDRELRQMNVAAVGLGIAGVTAARQFSSFLKSPRGQAWLRHIMSTTVSKTIDDCKECDGKGSKTNWLPLGPENPACGKCRGAGKMIHTKINGEDGGLEPIPGW